LSEEQIEETQGPSVNVYSTTVDFFSPNKMLVESVTMIYIIAFMLMMLVIFAWRGPSLSPTQMMLGFFGLIFTSSVAIRQYASFR